MALNIALNIVMIIFMGVGLAFIWKLQKTLNGIHKSRMDMEKFVGDFSGTITRAQRAIQDLQQTARELGSDIEGQISRAQALRDELSFLVETADKVANRLSDSASMAQQDAKSKARAEPVKEKEDMVKPVQEVKPVQAKQPEPPKAESAPQKSQQPSMPSWVKPADQNAPIINAPVADVPPVSGLQFGARKAGARPPQPTIPTDGVKEEGKEQPRSQAERELLQAVEKMK